MSQRKININAIQSVFLIGIGGIGMSAIAQYFLSKGKKVAGYDRSETKITRQLEANGVQIYYSIETNSLPRDIDCIVYTPAIPGDHEIWVYYQSREYYMIKRSEVLGMITENSFNICIAGTHGKTTTSAMIAHILRDSGYGCNAFLGGISANYNTNFWSSERNVYVVEADEYDRSFLRLNPDIAVVTTIEADHLDIYENEDNIKAAFREFVTRIKEDGLLVKKLGVDKDLKAQTTVVYSLQNDNSEICAENIRLKNGGYVFDLKWKEAAIKGFELSMGGMHNVENMVAAIAVAFNLQINEDKLRNAVKTFKGVKRRFEYVIKQDKLVFIDDYAHHPEELRSLINGAKALFPGKRCTLIFQPHLYSRTRDFADEFAKALSGADRVIVLPVYPAREEPIAGVSSNIILDRIEGAEKKIITGDAVPDWIKNNFYNSSSKEFGELLITAGAGNIDQLVEPVKQRLIQQQ